LVQGKRNALDFPGFTAILDEIPDLGSFFIILVVQGFLEFFLQVLEGMLVIGGNLGRD